MTAKQRAARARFKAVVAEAKKLRKKNPSLTQAEAVKQAWAISYSKQRSGKKVGATRQTGTSNIKRDKQRKAKPPGKRKSKRGAQRKYYYEYRKNRTDKPGSLTGMKESHKDTKSHNVNIRVVSGIGQIKREAEQLLKSKYGNLAAKKLTETTKRGKNKIQKEMSNVAAQIRKIGSL